MRDEAVIGSIVLCQREIRELHVLIWSQIRILRESQILWYRGCESQGRLDLSRN